MSDVPGDGSVRDSGNEGRSGRERGQCRDPPTEPTRSTLRPSVIGLGNLGVKGNHVTPVQKTLVILSRIHLLKVLMSGETFTSFDYYF